MTKETFVGMDKIEKILFWTEVVDRNIEFEGK